jgi:hypothetical protein
MTKQFWSFLGIGLAVVGIIAAIVWFSNESSHLVLTGKILKVRVLPLDGESSLVLVDFRVTNPTAVLFKAGEVTIKLVPRSGEPSDGMMVTKRDVDAVFNYQPVGGLAGPKFNDVFSLGDTIPPGKTLDRMAEARFEFPTSVIERRKNITLYLQDVDGPEAELTEQSAETSAVK